MECRTENYTIHNTRTHEYLNTEKIWTRQLQKSEDFHLNFIHCYFIINSNIRTSICKKKVYKYCKMIMNRIIHVLHRNVHHFDITVYHRPRK